MMEEKQIREEFVRILANDSSDLGVPQKGRALLFNLFKNDMARLVGRGNLSIFCSQKGYDTPVLKKDFQCNP
jgi:hypothetical protein